MEEAASSALTQSEPVLLRQAFGNDGYLNSACYDRDLIAVRAIWSAEGIAETAGCVVFLTYLTLPALLSVRASDDSPRMANSILDGKAERLFLRRLLGLVPDQSWIGGIRNAKVRRMVTAVSDHHQSFPGMRPEYLNVVAQTLTLAPLRIHYHSGCRPDSEIRTRYWRYMTAAMSLMGANLADEGNATVFCSGFVAENFGLTIEGERMIEVFARRHPGYTRMALPVLFTQSRSLAVSIIEESDA